ncbi:hypothetical protein DQ384_05160 [Sphaerisporangium album]|uniref:Uncharacterized protein n=1 Tax=Sphaerisporangium album TaxID=509200 RepID=A0A367FNW8_9ACTN|nr:hypothetical protein DQ384_05160 [Sphaerisporangium album]
MRKLSGGCTTGRALFCAAGSSWTGQAAVASHAPEDVEGRTVILTADQQARALRVLAGLCRACAAEAGST